MRTLSDRSRDILRDCHFALKWLWIIVMGFALKESIETFLYVTDARTGQRLLRHFDDYNWISIAIFAIFVITLVRFFHGDNRYLDCKYLEAHLSNFNPKDYSSGKRFFDLYLLLTHGVVFYFLAVSQNDPVRFFALYAFGLLLLNAVWLAVVWLTTSDKAAVREPLLWAINNLIHVVLFAVLFAAAPLFAAIDFELWALLIAGSNCFFDYFLTWNYYFPALE